MSASTRLDSIEESIRSWRAGIADGQETVADILTDLHHFARIHAVDWENAVDRSDMHYTAENDGRYRA